MISFGAVRTISSENVSARLHANSARTYSGPPELVSSFACRLESLFA
jgi:hypothetical protein